MRNRIACSPKGLTERVLIPSKPTFMGRLKWRRGWDWLRFAPGFRPMPPASPVRPKGSPNEFSSHPFTRYWLNKVAERMGFEISFYRLFHWFYGLKLTLRLLAAAAFVMVFSAQET
jgi:hypothetical protein